MKFTIACLLLAFLAGCNSDNTKAKEKPAEQAPVQTQATETVAEPAKPVDLTLSLIHI